MGGEDLFLALEELPSELREKLRVRGTSCLGECDRGPVARINGKLYHNVTPAALKETLRKLGRDDR
jgi:NADH:ubiquinone oxidoreductase subunit E